ncbi:hypothetical protein NMG60_11004980 [Bertholletia excelsa]
MCMNSHMELLPGLPNDVAMECLIRVPFEKFSVVASVCKDWKSQIQLPEFQQHRKAAGLARSVIVLSQARANPERNSCVGKLLSPPVYRLTLCEPETGRRSELPPPAEFSDGLPMFCHLLVVGSELVVMGGCDPVTWQTSNMVYVYNFIAGEWRRGSDMPGPRRSFFGSASGFDRTVYVAGGHDDEKNALKSVMMYDVAKDEWTHLPDMSKERDECKAVFHRGKLHVIGGYPTSSQGRFKKDAEAFDPKTKRWDPAQEDFLDAATCPRTCIDGGDGKLYMCREGSVTVQNGATWEVLGGLPDEVRNVAYVTAWQGQVLVIGSAMFGEPHRTYVMDLKNCTWTKLESPDEYSGHVQSGCWFEI